MSSEIVKIAEEGRGEGGFSRILDGQTTTRSRGARGPQFRDLGLEGSAQSRAAAFVAKNAAS